MRRAGWMFVGMILMLAGLIWLAASSWGLRLAANILEMSTEGRVQTAGVSGSLLGPLKIDRLSVQTDTGRIEATGLDLDWRPLALLHRRLEVTRLQVATLTLRQTRPSAEPMALPASLRLPLAISAPEISVDRLRVEASTVNLSFTALRMSLEKPAQRYQLRLVTLTSPLGESSGELELDEDQPYALHAWMRLVQPGQHEFAAKAVGSLTRLQLTLTSLLPQRWHMRAVITPFKRLPLQAALLQIDGIDPARWRAGWPSAALAGRAKFSVDREGRVQGRLRLVNAQPGSLDTGRLPLVALSGRLQGSLQDLALKEMVLDLGQGGRLAGRGVWRQGALSLDLTTSDLDPRALYTRLRSLRLAGRIRLKADAHGQGLDAQLAHQGYTLALRVARRAKMLEVVHARLTGRGGSLDLSGSLDLAAPHAFRATGYLASFDPSVFGNFPAAQLNLHLQAAGQLKPQPAGRLEFKLRTSRWRGHPLAGGGRLHLSASRLSAVDIRLALADNHLHIKGAYGGQKDQLTVGLDARRLDRFHPDLAGRIQAKGWLIGRLDSGSVSLRVQTVDLRWGPSYRLERLQGQTDIDTGRDGRVHIEADLEDLVLPAAVITAAEIRGEGQRSNHHLRLAARGPEWQAHAHLAGAWQQGWTGKILELVGRGQYVLRLLAPASISWRANRLALGPADLDLAATQIHLHRLVWQDGRLQTAGSFARLDPRIVPAVAERLARWDGGLHLGGAWDLSLGDVLSGTATLWREAGDLVLPTTPLMPLGLEALRLELKATEGWLRGVLTASGARLGRVRIEAASPPIRRASSWGLSGDAPLTGDVRLDLPDLAWLGPVIDRRGLATIAGRVHARITLTGSVAQPRLDGRLVGEGLALSWPELGLKLHQGVLKAVLVGDELRLTHFDIQAGEGRLRARGCGRWSAEGPRLDLEAQAEAFQAMNLPTRQLVVSGKVGLAGLRQTYTLRGSLRAERARILLPREDMLRRSEDVVVLGRQAVEDASTPLLFGLDLTLDLGPRFFIKGRGLDARLEGQLRLRSEPHDFPRATGSIRVAQGSYRAYGQRLSIERGVLDFQGPLDNPGLDILAMRTGLEVEAGVAIGGTALAPRVRLVSRPDVPDSEKLSWLVLGHGSASASGPDLQLLSLAADALLSAGESVSLQASIAQAIGLDEVSIKGSGALEETVVSLGKRLSSRAYLSYEQGLDGLNTLVRLSYSLSRRWSVKAQTGRENTVDLFYTLEFD